MSLTAATGPVPASVIHRPATHTVVDLAAATINVMSVVVGWSMPCERTFGRRCRTEPPGPEQHGLSCPPGLQTRHPAAPADAITERCRSNTTGLTSRGSATNRWRGRRADRARALRPCSKPNMAHSEYGTCTSYLRRDWSGRARESDGRLSGCESGPDREHVAATVAGRRGVGSKAGSQGGVWLALPVFRGVAAARGACLPGSDDGSGAGASSWPFGSVLCQRGVVLRPGRGDLRRGLCRHCPDPDWCRMRGVLRATVRSSTRPGRQGSALSTWVSR